MPLGDSLKKVLAQFNGQAPGETAPTPPPLETPAPAPSPAPAPAPAPAPPAPKAQFAAPGTDPVAPLDEETATFKATQIVNRAVELADRLIADGHLYSAGRNAAIAVFSAAGFDNEESGPSVATFSDAKGNVIADRVQLVVTMLENTPKSRLFENQMPVTVFSGTRSDDENMTQEQLGKAQAEAANKRMGYNTNQSASAAGANGATIHTNGIAH